MTPHTPTLPPTEPAMWRRLLAAAHPDRAGDHELFIWATNLREVVCEGHEPPSRPPPPGPTGQEEASRPSEPPPASDSVPFDSSYDFDYLTARALRVAGEVEEPYAGLLQLLEDCEREDSGPLAYQQERGASYKQLAAIGHAVGMAKGARVRWYRVAESIPLSRRHAGHILARLKRGTP